VNIAVQYTEAQ